MNKMVKNKLFKIEDELYNFIGYHLMGGYGLSKYETLLQLKRTRKQLIDLHIKHDNITTLIQFIKMLIELIEDNSINSYINILEKIDKKLINVINEI